MHGASVRAFLFDLDGVLVDTARIIRIGWTRFAQARGITIPEEDYQGQIYGRRTREILIDYFAIGPSEADSLIAGGLDDKTEIVRQEGGLAEIPGARDFVLASGAGGLKLALVTSASPANAVLALDTLQLTNIFDAIVTSADISAGKPAPDPYLAAALRVGVQPIDAVAFEDTLPGVQSAHAAGSRCVGVATTMKRIELSAADLVLDDFRGVDPAVVIRELVA